MRKAQPQSKTKLILRISVLLYLFALVIMPVSLIFYRTFEHGLLAPWRAMTTPEALHALYLTLLISLIAVVINTVFGICAAIAIERHRFFGRTIANMVVDLPFAVSPVVAGLALIILYGEQSAIGGFFADHGIQMIFSLPGMVLATTFVSLPFVIREVIPVLHEVGQEQEEAAKVLGANRLQRFWNITLPSIRWGLTYGVVLASARAIGEFGAVSVVSGKLQGETETLTLYVEQRYQQFDLIGAFAASTVLALLAIIILVFLRRLNSKGIKDGRY